MRGINQTLTRRNAHHALYVEYNIPFSLWLRKAKVLHARKLQEFGKPNAYMDLHPEVPTLKELCRRNILSLVTLERLHMTKDLVFPIVLKKMLMNLDVNEDFDLCGPEMEDTATFAYKTARHYIDHLHHIKFYIFPAKCKYSRIDILVKVFHNICNWCDTKCCEIERHNLQLFQDLRHSNFQSCLATIFSNEEPSTYFIIEQSTMSLKRLLSFMIQGELYLPEQYVWKLFDHMLSIVHCLFTEYKCSVILGIESFVISRTGMLQIENPLVTLPEDAHSSGMHSWIFGHDHKQCEPNVVSSLACVLFQIITLRSYEESYGLDTKLQHKHENQLEFVRNISKEKTASWFSVSEEQSPPDYSKKEYLPDLIRKCVAKSPSRRPTLAKLAHKVQKQLKKWPPSIGPNFSKLLLGIPKVRPSYGHEWWNAVLQYRLPA